MATNFPEDLDSFTNPQSTDSVAIVSHSEQHSNANDAIEALEAKVGTDNSLVSTSHDYRIRQLELNPVTGTASKIEQIVVNNTGSTLLKGQVVYSSGSVGASGKLRVSLSSNSTESGSSKTFGVLAENIINGGEGILVTEGLLEGVDTTGAADGDPVWLGPTAGSKIFGLTEKPSAPAHLVFLGIVVRGGNANNGSIFVKIQNGFELEELHNVSIATLSDNQVLRYDASTQLWKNETIDDLFDPAGAAADALTDANSYTDGAVSALVNGAPQLLDTLNELAAAINDDASFASTIATSIGEKQDTLTAGSNIDITGAIISVTGLSTDDVAEDVGNLYFTNQRALDATAASYDVVGSGAGALEQANDYTDGEITTALTTAQGYADTAQQNAEGYADGLAVNYDAAGAAATAETNANTYTDTALNDYTPTSTLDTTVGGYGYLKSADLSGYATESYVGTAIDNIIEGAPALLDTLNELAAAIGDDENFVTTINNALATKITASSTDTLTNKTISIQSGLTSVSGYDDITGFFGQSGIVVLQDGIDKGGRIDISSEGVITQSAAGTGYTSGLAIIGGGTRVAIGTSNNTLTGKLSDFNAALLDADFATTVDITNAIQDASDYADGLAVNYDSAGAAATAQSNAEDYTDTAIAGLGNDIEAGYIPVTEKATAGGVASLNLSGKVPATQLDIDEKIQDVAAQMIVNGTHTNITVSYNDNTGALSFTGATGGGGGVTLTQEQIQDYVAPLFAHNGHTNITATYDDDNNRVILAGSQGGGGGPAYITISANPPSLPGNGDLWLDNDNGKTYAFDGEFWVDISGGGLYALEASTYTNENAMDAVAGALVAGTHTNITVSYNDSLNKINLSGSPTYTDEQAIDAVASAIVTGFGITKYYSDPDNTITLSVDTNSLASKTYANTAVTDHENDTTNIHGISDTSLLATKAYADNSAQIAATAAVSSILDSAPSTLNTLNELAAAINDDASYASTVTTALGLKAPIANPTFTGTVNGITKSMIDLANVDNTSDSNKPISTATQTALDLKATIASPTFTGTVNGITKSMIGLGNVDNTTDLLKPISTATQTALDLKASLNSATFTGTITLPNSTSIGNVSATEIGYLDGVTSSIQTQLSSKASTGKAIAMAIVFGG